MSLPVRERGLKYNCIAYTTAESTVAPRAGAWIEIYDSITLRNAATVAPRAGAWIEMPILHSDIAAPVVAPRAGAWIEICNCLCKI